jgi:multidrug efflux system membrane fusion protein
MMDEPTAERRRRRDSQIAARRPWIVLLVLILLGLAVWGAWALAQNAQSGGQGGAQGGFGRRGGRPATTVGVAAAGLSDIPVTLDALGTVTPAATVTVTPQVGGTITQILFREGQMVKRGQTLAVIDSRPLQMALLQAQGTLTRDEAQLANARLTLGRYRTLLAEDSIARQDVDTQAATVKQLQGTVMADRAAVGTARLNVGYARIVAPVSGRVGLRVVDVGNYIGAGDASGVAVITTVSPIDVEFTVPQDDVPRIGARANTGAALPVIALDRTRTITLDTGTFSTLDNVVDVGTGTVKAKARFANAGGTLFPSQFVNVRLELDTIRNAVVVPATALRQSSDGAFVITEGGDRLREGGKVQLPGQAAGRMGQGKGKGQWAGKRGEGGQGQGGEHRRRRQQQAQ